MLVLLDDVAYHGLLTRSQAVLLRHLMDAGRSVTRADLADALWAHREDGGGGDGTIHSFLNQLKPKLRPGFRIDNHRSHGWRLVVDQEALERAVVRQVADMLTDSRGDRAA